MQQPGMPDGVTGFFKTAAAYDRWGGQAGIVVYF
jgi:hypothetical protein